jgi:hypothetical protein
MISRGECGVVGRDCPRVPVKAVRLFRSKPYTLMRSLLSIGTEPLVVSTRDPRHPLVLLI